MDLHLMGQWGSQGPWQAPRGEYPSHLGAKGLLRKRSRLVIRNEPVDNGSLGVQKTKTASLKVSMR